MWSGIPHDSRRLIVFWNKLINLTEKLTPALRAIRQKEFYADPRFHASIAWALLDQTSTARPEIPSSSCNQGEALKQTEDNQAATFVELAGFSLIPPEGPKFHSIQQFPPTLVPSLIDKYGPTLTRANVATFEVTEIKVKIGKWLGGWKLRGTE